MQFITFRISVQNRLYFFVVFFAFITVSSTNSCRFDAKLIQVLRNEGFHRNLTYDLVIHADDDERWLLSDCLVGFDQELPAGLYTNTDELRDLKRAGKVNAIPKSRVNVELSTEQSSPSSVYVMGELVDGQARVWLPVHARYHQAAAGGGFATNAIQAPKLFLRCPGGRLDACEGLQSARFLCGGGGRETCSWKAVPFSMVTPPLYWQVPIGNTDQLTLVSSGTAAAVILGSLYVLKAVHEFKMRERNGRGKKVD